MSHRFFYHILLICQFEWQRIFLTRKGLLSLLAFFTVWSFILLYPIRLAAELLSQEEQGINSSAFLDFLGFSSLLHWQTAELALYWHVALFIFPLLSITLAADQTCSDRARGTLRFLSLRCSRDSLFFGRFASMMLLQCLLVFMSLLGAVVLALFREIDLFTAALNNSAAIMLNMSLVLLPFTALMAALSALLSSARLATIWAILIWSFLASILHQLAEQFSILEHLKILIPGYQLAALTQLSAWQTLQLAYIPVLQSILLLALGRWLMQRSRV